MPDYLPPPPVLYRAAALTAPVVAGAAAAWAVGGAPALLGVVVGIIASAATAIATVSWATRTVVVVAAGAAAGLGSGAADRSWLAAVLVAVAALAQAPASVRSAGIAAMLPVAAAIGASVPVEGTAAGLAAWTVAGGALIVAVARVGGISAPAQPVSAAVARRHAVVAAVAVGGATLLTAEREVGHGYWLVLTLAVVLRPVRGETVAGARDRAVGTIAGIGAAVAIALLLPSAVSVVVAVLCLVASNAWALAGNARRQALFTTPSVVLMSSSGVAGAALDVAAERLLLTLLGAVIALAGAVVLARWDSGTDTGTDSGTGSEGVGR